MSTFENPFYSVPSSPFANALWTSWALDSSLGTGEDEGSFKLDLNWQLPMYSMPDYSLPFENWSDQCPTPLSSLSPPSRTASMGQLTDPGTDMTSWMPALDMLQNSVATAAPILSPCAQDLATQSTLLQDYANQQSCILLPSNHSSPSDTSSASSIPSVSLNTKINRNSKTPIRCWEHSCGGRAFSSLGNYERHLREKSGRAKSFTCEQCGQRFTRSTAKNKHIRYGRCRMRQVQ
jgi:hypothetical protein